MLWLFTQIWVWVIVALAIAAWGLVIATAWAFNAVWQVLLG